MDGLKFIIGPDESDGNLDDGMPARITWPPKLCTIPKRFPAGDRFASWKTSSATGPGPGVGGTSHSGHAPENIPSLGATTDVSFLAVGTGLRVGCVCWKRRDLWAREKGDTD